MHKNIRAIRISNPSIETLHFLFPCAFFKALPTPRATPAPGCPRCNLIHSLPTPRATPAPGCPRCNLIHCPCHSWKHGYSPVYFCLL
uniref:Uncharacterized protein n=1 Tax=Strongyloides papillosus TaxID=174720 RepID=A0A0N5C4H4_STREA